ncbi:MAG: hypothetical protein OXC92_10275 [Flavobacteriaceae bacterium]|nr:hypothetical protein [Flavobacteriaceae bacterium]MCY4254420.1 hypothetical protein [Flavobacteriaceae bacterium]
MIGNIQRTTSQVYEVGFFGGGHGLYLTEQYHQLKFDYDGEDDETMGNKNTISSKRVFGLLLRRNSNNSFSLRASLSCFELQNPPSYKEFKLPSNRSGVKEGEFKDPDPSIELNVGIEYWLIPRRLLDWHIPQPRPYIFVGGGLLMKSPSSYELDDMPKPEDGDEEGKWKLKTLPILSSGVGVSINATDWLTFGVEFGARFTFEKFYNFKKPTDNGEEESMANGEEEKMMSGYTGNNWYYVFGISATISLKKFPLVW